MSDFSWELREELTEKRKNDFFLSMIKSFRSFDSLWDDVVEEVLAKAEPKENKPPVKGDIED